MPVRLSRSRGLASKDSRRMSNGRNRRGTIKKKREATRGSKRVRSRGEREITMGKVIGALVQSYIQVANASNGARVGRIGRLFARATI